MRYLWLADLACIREEEIPKDVLDVVPEGLSVGFCEDIANTVYVPWDTLLDKIAVIKDITYNLYIVFRRRTRPGYIDNIGCVVNTIYVLCRDSGEYSMLEYVDGKVVFLGDLLKLIVDLEFKKCNSSELINELLLTGNFKLNEDEEVIKRIGSSGTIMRTVVA